MANPELNLLGARLSFFLSRFLNIGPLRLLLHAVFSFESYYVLKKFCRGRKRTTAIYLDTVFCPLIPISKNLCFKRIIAVKGPHAAVLGRRFPLLSSLFHFLENRALRSVDCILSNGFDTQEDLRSKGYSPIFVGNGVDLEKFKPMRALERNPNEVRIILLGTLIPIKGISEALVALARAMSLVSCALRLELVGKGDVAFYIREAENLGISNMVRFLGETQNVETYANKADVSLCLSGGGGLSMSLLESMAAGCCVIAWDTDVYRQLIKDGRNGFLVRPGCPDALAGAIVRVANLQAEDRDKVGAEARATAMSHGWDDVCQRLLGSI